MNGNGFGRGALATVMSLALGLGATACSRDYTVGYLYATATTTGTTGVVDGYQIDYQSGALTQLANSPVPSGGRNPVTLVATPNGKYVYVLNRDDNDVVEFAVGTDGKLYAQHTTNVIGSFPIAAAVDPSGGFLYVVSTLQPGFTNASPGPGNITVFAIAADGSLDAGTQVNLPTTPTAIAAGAYAKGSTTNYIYAVGTALLTSNTGPASSNGVIVGFSHVNSAPALTPVPIGIAVPGLPGVNGALAGVAPSSIVVDPTARFVYVTDRLSNQLIGYIVQAGGTLLAMTNGPFATGQYPVNVIVDPRAKYLYVANFNSSSVSSYAIDQATGTPAASGAGQPTRTNPNCVTIDPALGIYLYASNNGDQTISGMQLSPNDGTLKDIQNTPFPASSLPTCAVAVANGSHATQVVN